MIRPQENCSNDVRICVYTGGFFVKFLWSDFGCVSHLKEIPDPMTDMYYFFGDLTLWALMCVLIARFFKTKMCVLAFLLRGKWQPLVNNISELNVQEVWLGLDHAPFCRSAKGWGSPAILTPRPRANLILSEKNVWPLCLWLPGGVISMAYRRMWTILFTRETNNQLAFDLQGTWIDLINCSLSELRDTFLLSLATSRASISVNRMFMVFHLLSLILCALFSFSCSSAAFEKEKRRKIRMMVKAESKSSLKVLPCFFPKSKLFRCEMHPKWCAQFCCFAAWVDQQKVLVKKASHASRGACFWRHWKCGPSPKLSTRFASSPHRKGFKQSSVWLDHGEPVNRLPECVLSAEDLGAETGTPSQEHRSGAKRDEPNLDMIYELPSPARKPVQLQRQEGNVSFPRAWNKNVHFEVSVSKQHLHGWLHQRFGNDEESTRLVSGNNLLEKSPDAPDRKMSRPIWWLRQTCITVRNLTSQTTWQTSK